MNFEIFRHIALFVGMTLLQVFVLNHICLFGCATPFLYIYFILLFRNNYPRWAVLVWAFALGLIMDTLQNTPGVAAASLTAMAFVQPYILGLFATRELAEDAVPSMTNLGKMQYAYYVAMMCVIFCVCFFTLEMMGFMNWLHWLECVAGSTVITAAVILAVAVLKRRKEGQEK